MTEVLLWWWAVEILLSLSTISAAIFVVSVIVGAVSLFFFLLERDLNGSRCDTAVKCWAGFKATVAVAAVSFPVAVVCPPKELAYTFVAVKAGEELSETEAAKDLYGEVQDIYGLAKDYLRQKTQEPEQ